MGAHRTGEPAPQVIARERAAELATEPAIVEAARTRRLAWSLDPHYRPAPCRRCEADGALTAYRVWGEFCVTVCRECLPNAIAYDPAEPLLEIEYGPDATPTRRRRGVA